MLRIRTGARYGLRWGLFGFVAAVLTLSADPINAAPYADIVVDANSGAVLHATNPDARRHPASLTKIMTLYLLFEQLDAGKLKLDTPLKVSAEASGQSPTKLGLKPGSTLAIEDAIKGMVTRSANDAAVVVAEAIAGSEDDFARLMTRKAQALGMNNTVYKNASGLPDDNQITTARDQSTLGRAIQERFPRYYKYFSIRTFTFRGESISNHNHLLGKVEGVDGIKTGYINASGFNLVTSVHRGSRYLVAVVMGGSSGGSRDARMRELINDKIALASIKRTAPMVAEASGTPEVRPEPMVVTKAEAKPAPMAVAKTEPKAEPKSEAKSEPKPEPMVVTKAEPKVAAAKVEPKEAPKAEAKAEPRFAVASATSLPVRFNSAAPPAEPAALRSEPAVAGTLTQTNVAAGSTDPIRPVLVKTLTVRPGVRTASLAASPVASPAAEAQPVAAPAPMAAAKAEPAAPPPAPAAAEPPASPPAPVAAAKPEPAAVPPEVATKPEPAAAPAAAAIAAKEEPAAPPPMAAVAAAAAKPEPTAEPANAPRPGASSALPAPVAAAAPVVPTPKPAPAPPAAKVAAATSTAKPAAAAPTAKPQHRPGWIIQVGAFPAEQAAQQRLSTVQSKASKMLSGAEAFTETVDKGGTTYYRARFAGLDKDKAEAACKYLKKNDVECVTVKN